MGNLPVAVRDGGGRLLFESGGPTAAGAISGNDNDDDPSRFEPHYTEIADGGQVQIYESVMADSGGAVTTGLLRATQFVKDNRLLPQGFDKASASPEIAVYGAAQIDADFEGGRDSVRYVVDTGAAAGPYDVTVELWYQPIGFRWAQNLAGYDAPEPRRFVRYYDAMASGSGVIVATATVTVAK